MLSFHFCRKVEAMKSELKLLKEMIVAVAPSASKSDDNSKTS